MNMKIKIVACIWLVLFHLFGNAYSQTQSQSKSANADGAFNSAAAKHKRELKNLLEFRDISPISIKDTSAESISRVLQQRSSSSGAGYPENTGVLFYSYEVDSLSIWLVTENGIKAFSKQKVSEKQIVEAISNLRSALGVNSLQQSRAPRLRSEAIYFGKSPKISINQAIKNITDILIPVVIANDLNSTKHLIVVPTLEIGTVPYAVLKPFNTDSYLIDAMSVTTAPSLFDLGQVIKTWDPDFSSPLIVGNPYLPPNPDWSVPTLPGAEAEAQAIAKMLNAEALIGKRATKQEVVARAAKTDFLYIASHGIASSDNPLTGGFLMLSANEFEKGWWTAKEIQDSKFLVDRKIVILSACQTGLGKVHDAGVIGLARAFQIAGTPRVIMSLWSVDDEATNELMQIFMKHLIGGKVDIPSEALRQAMLEVKKKRPKQSEWASFVLFGTPR